MRQLTLYEYHLPDNGLLHSFQSPLSQCLLCIDRLCACVASVESSTSPFTAPTGGGAKPIPMQLWTWAVWIGRTQVQRLRTRCACACAARASVAFNLWASLLTCPFFFVYWSSKKMLDRNQPHCTVLGPHLPFQQAVCLINMLRYLQSFHV